VSCFTGDELPEGDELPAGEADGEVDADAEAEEDAEPEGELDEADEADELGEAKAAASAGLANRWAPDAAGVVMPTRVSVLEPVFTMTSMTSAVSPAL
jgi:hypothetical protein